MWEWQGGVAKKSENDTEMMAENILARRSRFAAALGESLDAGWQRNSLFQAEACIIIRHIQSVSSFLRDEAALRYFNRCTKNEM